jgi:hypothetical protein
MNRVKKYFQFINENFNYKGFDISIERSGCFLTARIFKNNKQIGMVSLDDIDGTPYVNYSNIEDEYRKMGLGRYVYDLLETQLGKPITHGDIASSISAIKLWRKKLNNPNYLPDNFYSYWEDDAEEILKSLN